MQPAGNSLQPANPLDRTLSLSFRLLVIFAVIGILALPLGGLASASHSDGLLLAAVLTGIGGGMGVMICGIVLLTARRQAKDAREILSSEQSLGHWSCTQEEWDRHTAAEVIQSRKGFKIVLALVCIPIILLSAIAVPLGLKGESIVVIAKTMGVVAIIDLFLIVLIVGLVRLATTAPVRRLKNPLNHEVHIGVNGLVLGGRFMGWKLMGASLRTVKYEPGDPGSIDFRWLQPGAGAYGAPAEQNIRVPVPQSADPTARQVVEFFRSRFEKQI